jgi:hypothetical protein
MVGAQFIGALGERPVAVNIRATFAAIICVDHNG